MGDGRVSGAEGASGRDQAAREEAERDEAWREVEVAVSGWWDTPAGPAEADDEDVWHAFEVPDTERVVARVVTRLPDEATARTLAAALVEARLAACVHVREVWSWYRFDGEVREHREWELDATVACEGAGELEASVFGRHPYRVPAIERHEMRVSVTYAQWVREQTAPARP